MKTLIAIVAAALLCSCATSTVPVGVKHYGAVNPSNVRVIYQEPQRPYEVIAFVEQRATAFASVDRVTQLIREEAAKNGGDAILIADSKHGLVEGGTTVHGKVIRWETATNE